MITITGYRDVKKLYESTNSLVYRTVREADNQAVTLKVLKKDYPTPEELTLYR